MSKKDIIFVAIVIIVITILSLGSTERRTAATPDDETHRAVMSRQECLQCHHTDSIRPQPKGHTQADQCFQCHQQPKSWKRSKP
ncbi:MAG: hypothetical protein R8M38_01720 [Mariprofundaceae bacterium]